MSSAVRTSVPHFDSAPEHERDAVDQVIENVLSFEQGMGQQFKQNCEKWYRQYRGFRKFDDDYRSSAERDRDTYYNEAANQWGARLHIPLSFRTIETLVPRAIAHAPHLLVKPTQSRYENNAESVRVLLNAQQQRIDIDLPFQDDMRAGRIYGLGPGKSFWRREVSYRRSQKKRLFRPGWQLGKKTPHLEFDGPDHESIHPINFMWDPMGSSFRGSGCVGWAVHRYFLSLPECLERLRDPTRWNTESAQALRADTDHESVLRGMGSAAKYDEAWQPYLEASGYGAANFQSRGEQVHELLEWHDGYSVLTVLDRTLIVEANESPCCGMFPFTGYRPTPLQGQMVGIGDLEPLEHLQRELDTLRSQKRDAATIALCAGYVFDDAFVDRDDIVFGPAALIPVRNAGNIDNALRPIQVRDVPGSSVADEQTIRADIDAVSGASDSMDTGGTGTATEAQLVQASLGLRIKLSSRRFEIEVARNVARQFLRMDQRMIDSAREIRQPKPGEEGSADGWEWFQVDPSSLMGDFEVTPEGGSMAARDVPQERQDAMQLMNLFRNSPFIDQRQLHLAVLKKFGLERSEAQGWIAKDEQPVPPAALQILESMGVPRERIEFAVAQAQQQDPMLPPSQAEQQEQQQQEAPA